MRSLLRAGVLVLAASLGGRHECAGGRAGSAAVDAALKSRVERRFRVLQVRDGLVLTPRREVRGLQSIEIRDGVIAVDGTPTTGAQLRERLGADADLVLQVSYLSADALAAWAAPKPRRAGRARRRWRGQDAGKRGRHGHGPLADEPPPDVSTGARARQRCTSAAASSSAKTSW